MDFQGAHYSAVSPKNETQLVYENYHACRFSTVYVVEKTRDFQSGTGLLFCNRYRTLLRLLDNEAYFAENDIFKCETIGAYSPDGFDVDDIMLGFKRFYCPSSLIMLPSHSPVVGLPISTDILSAFVTCLDGGTPVNFTARFVGPGMSIAESSMLLSSIVVGIKHAWGKGIPWCLSGVSTFRECVEKATSHLKLFGTQLFDEKMRLHSNVGAYNPFRKEFRVTCASGFGLEEPPYIRHRDLVVPSVGGYLDPSNIGDFGGIIVNIDDFPNPYQIMKFVLGDTPYYSPYSAMYSANSDERVTRFPHSCYLPLPTAAIRKRAVGEQGEYNIPMPRYQAGYNCMVGVNVSQPVQEMIYEFCNNVDSENQWCALMVSIPGLADAYNAVVKGRFYYDGVASKLVACEGFASRPQQFVPTQTSNDIYIWVQRANDESGVHWGEIPKQK